MDGGDCRDAMNLVRSYAGSYDAKLLSQAWIKGKVDSAIWIVKKISKATEEFGRCMENKKDQVDLLIAALLAYLIKLSIILKQIGSAKMRKANKDSLLAAFQIPLSLPFKIRPFFTRASLRYERNGHWNQKQKLKHAIFVKYFRNLFEDPSKWKSIRLYEMMSDMIITRNPNQCRSHHQKMEKYRITIDEIISGVAEKYDPRVFEQLEKQYLVLIKGLLENQDRYIRKSAPIEPVKYIYTTYIPCDTAKNPRKTQPVKEEDPSLIQILYPKIVQKQENRKTADSYTNKRLPCQEESYINETPFMEFKDINPKQEDHFDPILQSNMQLIHPPSQPEMNIIIPQEQAIIQPSESKSYLEEQLKILEILKNRHVQTAYQLSSQLEEQKQCIKNYEVTIRAYRVALGLPIEEPSFN